MVRITLAIIASATFAVLTILFHLGNETVGAVVSGTAAIAALITAIVRYKSNRWKGADDNVYR
jgi:tryptophan-rich sensory protein